MGDVQHITRFFTRNWQKMARPSLRPVEDYKERVNFTQYRIHHNRANSLHKTISFTRYVAEVRILQNPAKC
jgi:hypothetical protein